HPPSSHDRARPAMTPALVRGAESESAPQRRLGLLDATALVAGWGVGPGGFIVSADIARRLPAPGWLLVVWALAGLLTVAGARSYGAAARGKARAGGPAAH